MKISIINNKIDIVAESGEELNIVRNTVYPDRIVVFKTIEPGIVQELHFDNLTGQILDREKRRINFPKFEYIFDDHQILGIAEHRFLDELDFNGYEPKGIDIETITVKLFQHGKEVNAAYHMHAVNKQPTDYYETVKGSVDRYIETENAHKKKEAFLQTTYAQWSSEEKALYHYKQILLQDKMQGGYPSIYTTPAAIYLSKLFIDQFQEYDNNTLYTLELIANKFSIDTIHLHEMIQYDPATENWKRLAKQLGLMN